MKKDLTNLLKKETVPPGFENLDSAKEYLARYLLNYINIELEGLPKEEWEKTLITWAKMCAFARSLIPKSEEERQKLYEKFNFDLMMQGIAEDLRQTFIGMLSLGILKEKDPPYRLILKAAELVKGNEELIKRWELNPEIVDFIHEFFSRSDQSSARRSS